MSAVISVVIPCFGQAAFVKDAIRSLTLQSYNSWECALVYNEDESGSIIHRAAIPDARIVLVPSPPLCTPAARNLGLSLLTGRYVVALDADDMLGERFLERGLNIFRRRSTIKVVYGRAWMFGDIEGPFDVPDYSPDLLTSRNMIYSSAMFRRQDFDLVGGYDESLAAGLEDWDLWLSLLKCGGEVVQLASVELMYRQHKGSKTATITPGKWMAARRYVMQKHSAVPAETSASISPF